MKFIRSYGFVTIANIELQSTTFFYYRCRERQVLIPDVHCKLPVANYFSNLRLACAASKKSDQANKNAVSFSQ